MAAVANMRPEGEGGMRAAGVALAATALLIALCSFTLVVYLDWRIDHIEADIKQAPKLVTEITR